MAKRRTRADMIAEAEAKERKKAAKPAADEEKPAAKPAAAAGSAKKKARKTTTARKKSGTSRVAAGTRMKAVWSVFDNQYRRVSSYEYRDRKAADDRARELTQKKGAPHIVRPERVPMREDD